MQESSFKYPDVDISNFEPKLQLLFSSTVAILFIKKYFSDKVVCYWGTWSVYRWGNALFQIENVNPNLCTHIIYGFVGIQTDGSVRLLDSYLDVDRGIIHNFKPTPIKFVYFRIFD